MATVYSVKLFRVHITGTGFTTEYTVPAGNVLVVRDVIIINTVGAPQDVGLGFNSSGILWLYFPNAVGSAPNLWSGRQVFTAGETIEAYRQSGSSTFSVSGYLLTA
jgi:hypothetical protein